jgi:endonuclease III
VKNEATFAKKFGALLKKIKSQHGGAAKAGAPSGGGGEAEGSPAAPREAVTQLVVAFLEWNASRKQAADAHKRLMAVMVDNNDLRVSHPHEIVAVIGERYPRAEERAARLHESLQEIYIREHAVSLDDLAEKPKKAVRQYLETLPGITPYVAAQVALASFQAHAVPVDDHLAELLREEEVVDPEASVEDVAAFLERQIDAGEALEAHHALYAWVDSGSGRSRGASGGSGGSKTTKKTTKKTSKKPTKKTSKR